MDSKELEALVALSDRLDLEGHVEESKALDTVLARVAQQQKMSKVAMTGGALKACKSLLRACESFCKKNVDARGENRKLINKVCDAAEDLCADLETLCGDSE